MNKLYVYWQKWYHTKEEEQSERWRQATDKMLMQDSKYWSNAQYTVFVKQKKKNLNLKKGEYIRDVAMTLFHFFFLYSWIPFFHISLSISLFEIKRSMKKTCVEVFVENLWQRI
jgi:hypothetical protein